jgi:hypothetical protein
VGVDGGVGGEGFRGSSRKKISLVNNKLNRIMPSGKVQNRQPPPLQNPPPIVLRSVS